MLYHMRTTINLPDDLILQAKIAALEAKTTLNGFIENALREALAKRKNRKHGREFEVTTFGSGGLLPGVNLDNSSALQDIMEPPDEIRKKLNGQK
jgi:hypothetical protein